MSIEILREKCTGCGLCARVCPGTLLRCGAEGAVLDQPECCWGCASCLKACPAEALQLYLGPDIGGRGGRLGVRRSGKRLEWRIRKPDGTERIIVTDAEQSNKY